MKVFINGSIVLEEGCIDNGFVRFDDLIREVGSMEAFQPKPGEEVIDVTGLFVCPGFVDVHIHGAGGYDTMDGEQEALERIAIQVRRSGVTSFLATTMTMPEAQIIKALDAVKHFVRPSEGAKLQGIHLEGPFIHAGKKGAQNETYIQRANIDLVKNHLDFIRIITLAPDTDGAFEFIEAMKAYPHVKLSIGHTCSDYDTAIKAHTNGVTHITHCFNAMPALHHREPGVIGAMMSGAFTTELIADDIHVHTGLYKGLLRSAGHDHLVLVTDSMQAGGLPDGNYELGGQAVIVKNGACRLSDGTLAGSVLTLDKAIRNFMHATQEPLYLAVRCASINPARVIGLEHKIGSIACGKAADFALLNRAYEVTITYLEGEALNIETD